MTPTIKGGAKAPSGHKHHTLFSQINSTPTQEPDVCFPFLFVSLLSLRLRPSTTQESSCSRQELSCDPKYVGCCIFIAHFVFVQTTRHLTHNPSQNTNTNQPSRPIILTALPLVLLALLPAIVATIAMAIPFVVRLCSWTSYYVFVVR